MTSEAAGDPTPAPAHLSPRASGLWSDVAEGFALDAHQYELLRRLCEAVDRCDEAREAIESHGLTYEDRFGVPRARPEVSIERDSRIAIARLTRELNLDVVPDESRPPRQGRRS